MRYSYDKLQGKIVEVFNTRKKFADALGISNRSLSLKLNNKLQFKQTEISKACELLYLEPSNIPEYFFTVKVQRI